MRILKIKVTIKGCQKFLLSILFCAVIWHPIDCYALDPPPITPIDEFFVLNNNDIPTIPGDWSLTISGAVENPLYLSLDDLMNYTPVTQMATLGCAWYTILLPQILIGNANWTGVPLKTIIEEANPLSGAASITFRAVDGYSRDDYSLDEIMQRDDILLAYGMNGETLPLEQGYPIRLVAPGNVGFEWVQWLESIEITTNTLAKNLESFPVHARIFEPLLGETIVLGTHTISGVAFVGEEKEVAKVEVSTNGGLTWENAQLLNDFVPNVWKLWEFTWEATEVGSYQIFAKAEDTLGNPQSENLHRWGWLWLSVTVNVDYDSDSDEIPDSVDNCPSVPNPNQDNYDEDGIGNACDNCPNDDNPNQEDGDVDDVGDACDNCPETANLDQTDSDSDCIGDACDEFPNDYDPSQPDSDSDMIGDVCDNCPNHYNPDQEDILPEGGNECPDACECEGDLNGDGEVQGLDTILYSADYPRSYYLGEPCAVCIGGSNDGAKCLSDAECPNGDCGQNPTNPCIADLNGDMQVSGLDTIIYKEDYPRTQSLGEPCPPCSRNGYPCIYPE